MKDFSKFLNSNISDELLAAYIDGKTTKEENELIEKCICNNSLLSETYEVVNDSASMVSDYYWELYKGDLRVVINVSKNVNFVKGAA